MKKIFYLIVLSFFINNLILAQDITFCSEEYGYCLQLPNEWEGIPESKIEEHVNYLVQKYGVENPNYDIGFQLKNENYFSYPYILTKVFNRNKISFTKYASFMEENLDKELKKIAKSKLDFMEIEVSGLFADYENEVAFYKMDMNSENGEKIDGVSGIVFIRKYIVYIYCYATKNNFDSMKNIFLDIIYSCN